MAVAFYKLLQQVLEGSDRGILEETIAYKQLHSTGILQLAVIFVANRNCIVLDVLVHSQHVEKLQNNCNKICIIMYF